MLTEKVFEQEVSDSFESLREGGDLDGAKSLHNIHYTTKKLFFSGLLKPAKKSGVTMLSTEDSKKSLNKKLFRLWHFLKNNQVKNFVSELRCPSFKNAIRSWGYSLESGVVS